MLHCAFLPIHKLFFPQAFTAPPLLQPLRFFRFFAHRLCLLQCCAASAVSITTAFVWVSLSETFTTLKAHSLSFDFFFAISLGRMCVCVCSFFLFRIMVHSFDFYCSQSFFPHCHSCHSFSLLPCYCVCWAFVCIGTWCATACSIRTDEHSEWIVHWNSQLSCVVFLSNVLHTKPFSHIKFSFAILFSLRSVYKCCLLNTLGVERLCIWVSVGSARRWMA